MSEVIRRDLEKRIHAKHRQWIRDSFALYEMAELDDYAFVDVISALLNGLIGGFMAADMTREQALIVVTEAVRMAFSERRISDP